MVYGGPEEFAREFQALLFRLEQCANLVRHLPPDDVFINMKRALDFAVLSMKHRGFHEETEWRVIHQHSAHRPDPPFIPEPTDASKRVYQIPLENCPEANLWGAEIGESLDRVIVGPVRNFDASRELCKHWVEVLESAGISNAEDRVVFCGIPFKR